MFGGQKATQRDFKDSFFVLLSILFILLSLDYISITGIYQSENLLRFFLKSGELLKALYFLILGITAFYSARGTFKPAKPIDNTKKIGLFVLGFFSIAILIFINVFPKAIILYLYPLTFGIGTFCISVLALSYHISIDYEDDKSVVLTFEKKPSELPYAITFPLSEGFINIPNPFKSALVIGGAGAGKTYSIFDPYVFYAVKKDYSMLVYDYKFPNQANLVYSSLKYHKKNKMPFYLLSFSDLQRSHRFNPIEPKMLLNDIYVEEFCFTLFSNLDRAKAKDPDFWFLSSIGLFKAIICFLKKHHPEYCTLPHAINFLLRTNTKELVSILSKDMDIAVMSKPVAEAVENNAGNQLAGVMSSISQYLNRINGKEIAWVLSGHDFTLDLNNPDRPKTLVIGNDPNIENAISPVVALIINIAMKLMNAQNKHHSAVIIDEFPTITLPNFEKLPNTARYNKVAVLVGVQDFSQMDKYLGVESRKAIVSSLGTQFYGQTKNLETAEYASKMLGYVYKKIASSNKGISSNDSGDSSSEGISFSEQKREIILPQEIIDMPLGSFAGKLVDSENSSFYAKFPGISGQHPDFKEEKLPAFVEDFQLNKVDFESIDEKFKLLLSNPNTIMEDTKYSSLLYKHNEQFLTQDFRDDLKNFLVMEMQSERINQVIEKNFRQIVDEVDLLKRKYQ